METILIREVSWKICADEDYDDLSSDAKAENNRTFLSEVFDMLIFAETYNNMNLLSAAAERVSVLPMETFTMHPSYIDVSESTKIKILMNRLQKFDRCEVNDDKPNFIY